MARGARVVKTIDRWWWHDISIWEAEYGRPNTSYIYRSKWVNEKRVSDWCNDEGFTVEDISGYKVLGSEELDKAVKLSDVSADVKRNRDIRKKEVWDFDKVERKLESEDSF